MDETVDPVEWRVDPWTSATVRWLCLLQVALADAGLLLAGVGVLVAFAVAVTYGSVAVVVLVGLLVVARGRLVAPLEHWRWHGSVTHLGSGAVLVALTAGSAGYLLAFRLVGVATVGLVPIAVLATGTAAGLVGGGMATGRIDPGTGRLQFAGRGRSLERVESIDRYRIGDLVLLRLRGPGSGDDLTWLPVPAADVDRVRGALEGPARQNVGATAAEAPTGGSADDAPTTEDPAPDCALAWRRLSTPQIALAVLGLGLAAVGAGAWATIDASGLAAGPLVLIGLGAGFVGGAIAA